MLLMVCPCPSKVPMKGKSPVPIGTNVFPVKSRSAPRNTVVPEWLFPPFTAVKNSMNSSAVVMVYWVLVQCA